MSPTPPRTAVTANCRTCGRSLAETATQVTEWAGGRLTYYCTEHDPRRRPVTHPRHRDIGS